MGPHFLHFVFTQIALQGRFHPSCWKSHDLSFLPILYFLSNYAVMKPNTIASLNVTISWINLLTAFRTLPSSHLNHLAYPPPSSSLSYNTTAMLPPATCLQTKDTSLFLPCNRCSFISGIHVVKGLLQCNNSLESLESLNHYPPALFSVFSSVTSGLIFIPPFMFPHYFFNQCAYEK